MRRVLGGLVAGAMLLTVPAFGRPPSASTEIHVHQSDAAAALTEFANQSDVQLIFAVDDVQGVATHPVDGNLAPAEALRQMLAGTKLEAKYDRSSGAFAVRRRRNPIDTPRTSSPENAKDRDDEELVGMDAFQINGQRDAGLIAQSIFRTDAEAPIYHQVISRREIEQLGVTSIAELMTLVAGYSGEGMENLQTTVNLAFDNTGTTVYSGAFLKMRGFDSARTAVLLNGRRLPNNVDSRGPDLSRIPLGAVERIDVLPFSGSAMYGENVIGGAVNIVLRKDYVGRSLTSLFGTTTRGGGNEFSVTATQGFTSRDSHTKATVIADYQRRDALRLRDRPFLERALEEQSLVSIWSRSRSVPNSPAAPSLSNDERVFLLTVSPSDPGVVIAGVWQAGLGIPGKPAQQWTLIPRDQNGTNLTTASFPANPQLSELKPRTLRSILRRPTETYSFTTQLEHTFIPDRLELYSEISYSHAEDHFNAAHQVSAVSVGPEEKNNPFHSQILIYFDPVDLPENAYDQNRRGARLVLGLRGRLIDQWHWTADAAGDRTQTSTLIDSPDIPLNALMTASRFTVDRFAIYNPLADHGAYPVSRDTIDRFFRYRSTSQASALVAGFNARVYGPLVELPAGPIQASFKGEYRYEVNHSDSQILFSRDLYAYVGSLSSMEQRASIQSGAERFDISAAAVELQVPVISPNWQPVPVHRLEIDWGARISHRSHIAQKATQIAAIKLAATRWLAFRASYSEGFSPPPYSASNAPVTGALSLLSLTDPLRGRAQIPLLTLVQGGRPGLRSETSKAYVFGVIFKPHTAPAVMLTADAWNIQDENALRVPFPQEILEAPNLYPGFVTRAPPSEVDMQKGQPGIITQIDDRAVNIASVNSAGLDVGIQSHWRPTSFGTFDFSLNGTIVTNYEESYADTSAVDKLGVVGGRVRGDTADAPLLRRRGRAMLGWRWRSFRAALGANYNSSYIVNSVITSKILGATASDNVPNGTVGSSTLWDLQLSYGSASARRSQSMRLFGRTTWTLGVRNLFDRMPTYRFDGVSFYSHFEDPRMRFVYLRLEQDW